MSTHCAIGIEMEDGSITGCYVHYDGFEEHMVPAIESYIEKNTTTSLYILIARAQSKGGFRSFGEDNDLLDDCEPYVITSDNWSDDHMGTYAWYLINYNTGLIDTTRRSYG